LKGQKNENEKDFDNLGFGFVPDGLVDGGCGTRAYNHSLYVPGVSIGR
jgi:hypothetical protein